MPAVDEVSFELERFEWTPDDRLEVVGRWIGVRGRRMSRPALTVEAGGRRHRVSGSAESDESSWRASFDWDGSRGEVESAELELGRSLVVELPPPRRRRRRATSAEGDLRAQVAELRAMVAELRAERDAAPSAEEVESLRADATEAHDLRSEVESLRASSDDAGVLAGLRAEAEEARAEAERLAAELEKLRAEKPDTGEVEALRTGAEESSKLVDELAGLRLAHGSLRAAHEQLEDEVEELRGVRDERDELAGQLERLRSQSSDAEQVRAELGELIHGLQERASEAENQRDRLTNELAVAREDVTRLKALLAAREETVVHLQEDAEKRVESERASTTEVHARLATAREEAQRTLVAEAEETERLRAELEQTREDGEKLLAAERAEVARLREELLNSERLDDGESDESSRRMVERITRDLERERATSRNLRRELDDLRSRSAEHRRAVSSSTGNGTLAMDEGPAPATAAGRNVRTPLGTQRRVDAARVAAATRVPRVPPSPVALWATRILAAVIVAAFGIAFVMLISAVT
jgi:chromosome segregation ATPase